LEAEASGQGGGFAVELPVFTGPFRLLADLILDRTVDVCDVSVAEVTDAYLTHASDAGNWNLEEATWFLAICAVLLELKVDRLMPKHETLLSEEDALGTSPDLVYARSLELAAFRKVSLELTRRLEDAALYHYREVGPARDFEHLYPDVMEKVTPQRLARIAFVVLTPPVSVDLSHVTPIRVTVADAISAVTARLEAMRAASFRDLVADCDERIQVVVRFLALLELYREGRIDLSQAKTFGEIDVVWQG
jgi:segregation and condensation protein A